MGSFSVTNKHGFDVEERGLRPGAPVDSCVIVIFGATGDLTRRELLPSLFELHRKRLLPERFAVVGFSPGTWGSTEFRDEMRRAVEETGGDMREWEAFAPRLSFVRGDATSAPLGDYAALAEELSRVQSVFAIPGNMMFHMAVPPTLFGTIADRLGACGLARSDHGWRRLVVEKPFGADQASARNLDRQLQAVFGEDQIYRIDHFLGKETVQNMLVFRFANPSFEPVWNRNYIDHVQITVSEDIGIGTRAAFYEHTGVVRDMVQNHLLQLLCITATEPPVSYDATSLRNETMKVLEAVNLAPGVDGGAVLGQYGSGEIAGQPARGYRQEDGVAADSVTATFAAIKLTLDNWRWADVPFYLRTGKRLGRKLTEVAIQFKPTPHLMFRGEPRHTSMLVFEVQPNEGIVQTFAAKQPGPELAMRTVKMNFGYAEAFGVDEPPRAYAWLLRDVMQGDQTLFARADWITKAWQIVDPILERWTSEPPLNIPRYPAGSAGPLAADELIRRDGREWRHL